MTTSFSVVHKSLARSDGVAKVTGEQKFSLDISLPGMLHCKLLRSPLAHARITRIDTGRAKAHPGVHSVWTAADLRDSGLNLDPDERVFTILAQDEVLYHGQALAAVLADEPAIAEEAVSLIEVELEELPAVVDILAALEPNSPRTRGVLGEVDRSEGQAHLTLSTAGSAEVRQGNVSQRVIYSRGDIQQGLAEADVVIRHRWQASWVHQSYIEPHVAVVDCDTAGNFTVWTGTQGRFQVRERLARFLGIPENRITVEVTELGGGFGGKNQPFDVTMAAALALQARRPVKLAYSRSEDLRAGNPSPGAVVDLETGVKKDGTLTGMKARIVVDAGAYPAGLMVLNASNLIAACYKWPNLEIEGLEVLTNKAGAAPLRAPGVPQVILAVESQMDIMARAVGMDPVELRLKNAVEEGDRLPNGEAMPRIGLKECLEALRRTDFWRRRHEKGPNEGIGIAVGCWMGGVSPASVICTLSADGTINVISGATDITGVNTSFQQIAAETLGVPVERVSVSQVNTSSGPYASVSAGSKTLRTVGMAVRAAAEDVREQLYLLAAQQLEASPADLEVAEGSVRVKGSPDKAISFQVLGAMTTGFGSSYKLITGRGSTGSPSRAPSFVIHGVKLHVDPDTGEVTVRDVVCVQDVGLAINPMSVEGQMQGGVAQSLGLGLWEEMQFDERGILRNPTFLDYRLPTAVDLPRIETVVVEVPGKEEELWGARPVGESSMISGCAAASNAVADATGARVDTMPLTAERILRALGKI